RDEERARHSQVTNPPCGCAASRLMPDAQMAAFQFLECFEIGLLMLQPTKVRPRMKAHQLFNGAKHGGLQSVTSFALGGHVADPAGFVRWTREAHPSRHAISLPVEPWHFSGLGGIL